MTVGGGICAAAAVGDKSRVVRAMTSARFAFMAMSFHTLREVGSHNDQDTHFGRL